MEIIEIILKHLIPAIIQALFQLALARLKHYFSTQQATDLSLINGHPKMPPHQKYRPTKSRILKKKRKGKH